MTIITSGAKPCLSCRSQGGYVETGRRKPRRLHGLCDSCYQRARRHGTVHTYPRCGFVPVPNLSSTMWLGTRAPWTPAPWGRVPCAAAPEPQPTRWQGLGPIAFPHPTTLNPSAHARTTEAEAFAASWLARRTRTAA